jgi:hypothetical protein
VGISEKAELKRLTMIRIDALLFLFPYDDSINEDHLERILNVMFEHWAEADITPVSVTHEYLNRTIKDIEKIEKYGYDKPKG